MKLYRALTRDIMERSEVLKGAYAARDATMDALRESANVYRDLTKDLGERSPVLRGANATRYALVDSLRDSRDALRGLYRNDIAPRLDGFRSNVQDGLVGLLGGPRLALPGGHSTRVYDAETSGFDSPYVLRDKGKSKSGGRKKRKNSKSAASSGGNRRAGNKTPGQHKDKKKKVRSMHIKPGTKLRGGKIYQGNEL